MVIDLQNDGRHSAMTDESPETLMTPAEAAAYLERKWNRPFTPKDFSNLRRNHKIKATQEFGDIKFSLWSRRDLDNIEEPRLRPGIRGKGVRGTRNRRRKRKDVEP